MVGCSAILVPQPPCAGWSGSRGPVSQIERFTNSVVNILFISGAIALSTGQSYGRLVPANLRATITPFAFMA